jgi:general nucleoside transport system permease protein
VLAIVSGLLVGAIIIILTTENFWSLLGQAPLQAIQEGLRAVGTAYSALFTGSLGDPARILAALKAEMGWKSAARSTPSSKAWYLRHPSFLPDWQWRSAFGPALFNIGVEGQLFIGAIFAAYVGYAVTGLPAIIHIPLALGAGALGGALWGFIPGWLKAKTGGHEVINTIMMNYIAFRLSEWLLSGPMKRPDSFNPVSPTIQNSAILPRFFEHPIRFHTGFFVALFIAWLVYWFLFKTKWGFYLRTVGAQTQMPRATQA